MNSIQRKREENQWIGSYFEQRLCDEINGTDIASVDYDLSSEDMNLIEADAYDGADFLVDWFATNRDMDIVDAEYVGNHTNDGDCDIILYDSEGMDHHLEVKYVRRGTGTYYNGSMNLIARYLDFMEYTDYLLDNGYHDDLRAILEDYDCPVRVNESNASPVTEQDSSVIRHNFPEAYKEIVDLERSFRQDYVAMFYDYIVENHFEEELLDALLNKATARSDSKRAPEFLFRYSYDDLECLILTQGDILGFEPVVVDLHGESSLYFNDRYRATFGWQNGTGLCNPTVRVFLED